MNLYGKDRLTELLSDTASSNRLPHAILLTGERGSGRMTVAKYIAKLFLCGAVPCENCAVCSRINDGTHPDVIDVLREIGGKYGLTTKSGLKDIREFMESVAVKPNDADMKIYIFAKADEMTPLVQNTLLKNIEEPKSWVKYIFICESAESLLETIRSRTAEYRVPDCSVEDCIKCLEEEYHIEKFQAQEYSRMMSGNIGKCLEALGATVVPDKKGGAKKSDDEQEEVSTELKLMESARHAAAAVAARDSYRLCAALGEQTGRKEYSGCLEYFAGILRDAIAVRTGGELYSCGKAEAKKTAEVFDEAALVGMLEVIFETNERAALLNLNLSLCSAYITSKVLGQKGYNG